MSILIDKIKEYQKTEVKIKDKWYIAKWNMNNTMKSKLKDCIKILRNKAIALHFKEDEE